MLDDPKKEGLTTPDRRTHAKGGVDDKWRGYNPSTHRYPLHSRRQAVTLSDCHALTIPHSCTRELRNPHKPENPTGKPDSKPPPEATSRTPDPRTGPQVGHKACIAPTIQTLTWGFLKEVRHTVRLVDSRPLRGVEAPSAQSRPPLSRAAAKKAQAWRNQYACHCRRAADPRPTHAPFGNPHPSFRAGPPSADRQPSDMNP